MTTDRPARPGLQPHRTSLAWTRTALATAGLAALTLRTAIVDNSVLYVVATALLLSGASVTYVGGRLRGARPDAPPGRPAARLMLAVATPVLLALACATAAIVGHDLLA